MNWIFFFFKKSKTCAKIVIMKIHEWKIWSNNYNHIKFSKKKKLQPYQKKCTFLKQENVINWRKKKRGKSKVRQKKFKRREVRVWRIGEERRTERKGGGSFFRGNLKEDVCVRIKKKKIKWTCSGKKKILRALALENANAILFYHSKNSLYHYNILFYNTSTSQISIFLFYSLK